MAAEEEDASGPTVLAADASAALEDGRAARLRRAALARVVGLRIVVEDLSDYGNRAAILRTVESFGLFHVHEIVTPPSGGNRCVGDTARGRSIVNGAEKWLDLHKYDSSEKCVQELKELGFNVLAAMPPSRSGAPPAGEKEPMPIDQVSFGAPTALVFGNEARGVSSAMLAACDGSFTVPLPGLTESLNVSVAVAVCCHFGRHSRSRALGLAAGRGDLPPDEAEALVEDYSRRSAEHGFTASVRSERSVRGKKQGKRQANQLAGDEQAPVETDAPSETPG